MNYPHLGVGMLVHNSEVYMDYLEKLGDVSEVYELLLIQYLNEPDELNKMVDRLGKPIIAHTTRFSFGTDTPMDSKLLNSMNDMMLRCKAKWCGDHLCFTGVPGLAAGGLLPPIGNEESIDIFVRNILEAKKVINTPLLIENVVEYFQAGTITHAEILKEVVERADIGIVLSMENISSSKMYSDCDYYEFIDTIPSDRIVQIHCTIGNSQQQKEMKSDIFGTVYDKQLMQYKALEYLSKKSGVQPKAFIWELETETDSHPEVEELRERMNWAKSLFFKNKEVVS
ncbi:MULTISPECIES: DUF692 family multinuclear iron-containing protein [Bacillus amyloliquefaciens group]|uniref:multinuclear nonheme iron-dependent oxidase n=1 Tax=Bacillus amyloliquefaciens group TaxID=1938374 RepID=UPI0003AA689C|nr:DUF692 family multinuclear iron-containing protein [Bacillus velezensis]AUJ61244.1 hypothetical protein B6257_11915 [Bacillus velezensis]